MRETHTAAIQLQRVECDGRLRRRSAGQFDVCAGGNGVGGGESAIRTITWSAHESARCIHVGEIRTTEEGSLVDESCGGTGQVEPVGRAGSSAAECKISRGSCRAGRERGKGQCRVRRAGELQRAVADRKIQRAQALGSGCGVIVECARADEREACAMNVWIVNQLAQQPDADDRGVIGWLQEAEDQIRARGNK